MDTLFVVSFLIHPGPPFPAKMGEPDNGIAKQIAYIVTTDVGPRMYLNSFGFVCEQF